MTTHTLLRDLNVHVDSLDDSLDDRRIEVIANGLPLWVSAVDSAGHTRVYQRRAEGTALRLAWRAKKRTYREIFSSHRCRLVAVGLGALRPHSLSARLPGPAPALCQRTCKPQLPQHTAPGGRTAFFLPLRGRVPPAFLPCPEPARAILTGPCRMSRHPC